LVVAACGEPEAVLDGDELWRVGPAPGVIATHDGAIWGRHRMPDSLFDLE
jgi:hypothetical protein